MAQVHPFRAYRYNPAKVDFARALTQPYDKITPEMQDRYYASDPRNLIVVEKGREFPGDSPRDNVYTRAAASLQAWLADGVLVQDSLAGFYAYFQEYSVPGAAQVRRRAGFIGLGTLEDYEAGVILRHERTHAGPKADRLELLRSTRVNTGQLFMLYADPQKRIDTLLREASSASPAITALRDEFGVSHSLWPVTAPERITEIQRVMKGQNLVIADGHHRYETALNYRNEQRARAGGAQPDAPYERAMMAFFNAQAEGLTILPTHRLVSDLHATAQQCFETLRTGLAPYFDLRSLSLDEFRSQFAVDRSGSTRTIAFYAGHAASGASAYHLFTVKPGVDFEGILPGISPLQRELDVVLLHTFILEKILRISPEAAVRQVAYVREMREAIAAVDCGAAQLAFILNPVSVEHVMRIAQAREVMPQKSTDFYPKLLSGITIYRLDS